METSGLTRWFKWNDTSSEALQAAEESILKSMVHVPYKGEYIDLGPIVDHNKSRVWTITVNSKDQGTKIPLVMVHGLGSGVALWAKNLDRLAECTTVYAFDLLGFGRSSRNEFSSDPVEAELQFVLSLEVWRRKLGLKRFILLGHSLGGFIATAYALAYPHRVEHLILADPWGINKQPADLSEIGHIPIHHRLIVRLMEPLNPLWAIRAAGPFGTKIIQKIRADLISQFKGHLENPVEQISNYIYHCNAQHPAGESAFHSLMHKFGWAKNPMYLRLPKLHPDIAISLLHGGLSWIDHYPVQKFKEMRPRSTVDFHILNQAGHHLYADMSEDFNRLVVQICSSVFEKLGLSAKSDSTDDNENLQQ